MEGVFDNGVLDRRMALKMQATGFLTGSQSSGPLREVNGKHRPSGTPTDHDARRQ
jgi:hypothetical protein